MEKPQFAYTGAQPAAGYVGYVNVQETSDGVRFTVRSEGLDALQVSYVIPKDEAVALLSKALVSFGGPRRHEYWMPGDPDCPREIKAANGELHTLRCKRCSEDNPRSEVCAADRT